MDWEVTKASIGTRDPRVAVLQYSPFEIGDKDREWLGSGRERVREDREEGELKRYRARGREVGMILPFDVEDAERKEKKIKNKGGTEESIEGKGIA